MLSQPAFDAYYKWLGIPPKDQPPNHYRLLGLELFESDVEVIEAAANRQMAYLRQCATGEHAAAAQRLLDELSAAQTCLLDSKTRADYNRNLWRKTCTLGTADSLPAAEPRNGSRPGGNGAPLGDVAFGPTPSARNGKSPLLPLTAPERLPEPEPVLESECIERQPDGEANQTILDRAQAAYDAHDFVMVIRLLESQPVDDGDPEAQNLLESAKFSLDQIQSLSQELRQAWAQKDAKRVTEVANELISIQPTHHAANEAIRWANMAYWQFYDVRHRGWS
jgi:hypothetical protein